MPTLLDFRRRIRSVKNSQQITRAMKFVAAARLRRAQEAALAARPYAQELARESAKLATDLYAEEKVDSVYIIFSEFKSVMAPNLTVEKLLPIEAIGDKEGDKNKEKSETQVDYIYEQPEAQLLDKLLPRYV